MKYGIFVCTCDKRGNGAVISFTALKDPIQRGIIVLDAESVEAAAGMAADVLKTLGVTTYTTLYRSDTSTMDFPDYFVAEIKVGTANVYNNWKAAYRINHFVPLPKRE